jgi:hypothetical protein
LEYKLQYIKSTKPYKRKKKNISARISEVVAKSMELAKLELHTRFDLTFTMPEIIEKAFENALEEIKVETGGFDFYELEKFRYHIESLISWHDVKGKTEIDVDMELQSVMTAFSDLRYEKINMNEEIISMDEIIEDRMLEIKKQLEDESSCQRED